MRPAGQLSGAGTRPAHHSIWGQLSGVGIRQLPSCWVPAAGVLLSVGCWLLGAGMRPARQLSGARTRAVRHSIWGRLSGVGIRQLPSCWVPAAGVLLSIGCWLSGAGMRPACQSIWRQLSGAGMRPARQSIWRQLSGAGTRPAHHSIEGQLLGGRQCCCMYISMLS